MIRHERGVLDTNIVAAFKMFDPAELPVESAITAVTLGELSRGPYATDDPVRRAGRVAVLQYAEAAFGDPLPYDAEAARVFGQICAVVYAQGRQPRSRTADLMIAATAAGNDLPLFTANPKDFAGLESLVRVVAVTRPDGATG
ncbi:type II toxin-antitoxin system VapC family toxin [Nonomuraea roseoviolacea]|uniref:Nucleic acid-binding protein n=1 Tax=Nonomuraea roseoviolacea subsp. carminata TaxID=160689 RepID=A0ABT1K6A4_9ACTN|nr:type II toxin-antitoxin system VapC family toxin [Nonomuraea roseoviolacea]MCP2349533.1 putative nucleic acid-binding protein [Nonomuraea roseoviolacea subsp. carminata]